MLENDYPLHTQLTHLDWHTSGALANGSGATHATYYGVGGVPDVFFDGTDHVVGAGDSVSAYNQYKTIMANHYFNQGSKVILSGQLDLNADTMKGKVTIDLEIAPGESFGDVAQQRVRAALYENNIFVIAEPHTGNTNWNYIARAQVGNVVLTAANAGETQHVEQEFSINPAWDINELHMVVYVQRDTGHIVQQSALATPQFDCDLVDLDAPVGKSTAAPYDYDVELAYTGSTADDVTLTLDESALPVGWDAEIEWNSTVYPSTATIPGMTPSQLENVIVRVIPDGTPALGTVTLRAQPASNTSSAVGVTHTYHTFNLTPSIFLVDDDTGAASEVQYLQAIQDAGYFAVKTDVIADGNPVATTMDDYDVVIWNTGQLQTQTIGANVQTSIQDYLNGGGSFFLTSQGYLNHIGLSAFTTGYLGVSAFTSNVGAPSVVGVASDPIGDGLAFTMTPPFTDQADGMTPGAAVTWLNSGANHVGVHYDSGTFKTVFLSAAFEGLNAVNGALMMERVLDWLAPSPATGVNPVPAAATAGLELSRNVPNPFADATTIRFSMPQAGRATVMVYDVAGRRVATVLDRALDAGAHAVEWDGRNLEGAPAASGVYLVRLSAAGETVSKEIVRVK